MKKTLVSFATFSLLYFARSNFFSKAYGAESGVFDSLSMSRGACYGRCPVYSVEILSNGDVRYSGIDFVKVKGTQKSRISHKEVELLAAALQRVKFFELRDRYVFEEDGCVNLPTDFPSVSFSIKRAGKAKTVAFYYGCNGPNVPSVDLGWFSQTIDAVSKTEALVEGR
jgi:hypothetical protein